MASHVRLDPSGGICPGPGRWARAGVGFALALLLADPGRSVRAAPPFRRDRRVLTGVRVAETADTLTLGGEQGQHYVLSRSAIEAQRPQPLSLMPEGPEAGLTEEEFVDLVTFLSGRTEVGAEVGR